MDIVYECTRCNDRHVYAIHNAEADALAAFRAAANRPIPPCPVCNDVGTHVILIDAFQRTIKRTPANVR